LAYEANYTSERGSQVCQTKLKSSIEILDPDGVVIKPLFNKGQYYYSYVPPGSKVNFEVTTYSGGKPMSDEFSIQVITQDTEYMQGVMNEVIKASSNTQQDAWAEQIANGDTSEFISAVSSVANNEKQFKTVYSKLYTSDSNGFKKGYFTVPEELVGYFSIIISYAYSGAGQEFDFLDEFAPSLDTVDWLLDIVMIISLVLSWTGIGGAVFSALVARKIAMKAGKGVAKAAGKSAVRKLANRAIIATYSISIALGMMTAGSIGTVDINQYGCDFGDGHFHSYGGLVTDLDPNKIEIREKEVYEIYQQEIIYGGSILGAVLLVILVIPKIVKKKRAKRAKKKGG
tara:strand:+ start:110 stop:1138 length:1029 start_codon:yes stop_codon:yes gene_type:complete